MNWELTAANEALKALDRALKAEHRDGVLQTLGRYPTNEEMAAARRYCEGLLDDGPLVRN